nr:MAG TPA: GtCPES barrel, lyase, phycoerythrobilin [Caudoviricetes sp.]
MHMCFCLEIRRTSRSSRSPTSAAIPPPRS